MSSLIVGNSVETKPVDNRQRWITLAPFIKRYFDTGNKTLKDIAFDLAWADYLRQEKKDEMWKRFSEEIG